MYRDVRVQQCRSRTWNAMIKGGLFLQTDVVKPTMDGVLHPESSLLRAQSHVRVRV